MTTVEDELKNLDAIRLTIGTWVLAIATIVLVTVEALIHWDELVQLFSCAHSP